MLLFAKILLIVYFIAVNVYSFLLIKTQKSQVDEHGTCHIHDGRIFLAGIMGGAITVYVAMFIFKYRLQSLFLMVTMPVLIAVNAFGLFFAFGQNFGIVLAQTAQINHGLATFYLR